MLTPDNLMVISFISRLGSSDGKPISGTEHEHILLFNKTQISEAEVHNKIDTSRWEYDPRIIQVTREQLKYLKDKS